MTDRFSAVPLITFFCRLVAHIFFLHAFGALHIPDVGICGAFDFVPLRQQLWFSSVATVSRPLRFDFHDAKVCSCIVATAAPVPLQGSRTESALHWIAMDVSQFFDETLVRADVVVIVSPLPERGERRCPRRRDLETLYGVRESRFLRLRDQKMDVLGHDDVSEDPQAESEANLFQAAKKCVGEEAIVQKSLSQVTTESHEVRLPGFVEASESAGHGGMVTTQSRIDNLKAPHIPKPGICRAPDLG